MKPMPMQASMVQHVPAGDAGLDIDRRNLQQIVTTAGPSSDVGSQHSADPARPPDPIRDLRRHVLATARARTWPSLLPPGATTSATAPSARSGRHETSTAGPSRPKARGPTGGVDERSFRQEFEKLRTLRVPSVVRCSIPAHQGYVFFTMEVAHGVGFFEHVQQEDSLDASAGRVGRAQVARRSRASTGWGSHRHRPPTSWSTRKDGPRSRFRNRLPRRRGGQLGVTDGDGRLHGARAAGRASAQPSGRPHAPRRHAARVVEWCARRARKLGADAGAQFYSAHALALAGLVDRLLSSTPPRALGRGSRASCSPARQRGDTRVRALAPTVGLRGRHRPARRQLPLWCGDGLEREDAAWCRRRAGSTAGATGALAACALPTALFRAAGCAAVRLR